MPAMRNAIRTAMLKSNVTFLEPKQIMRIDTPQDFVGNVVAEVSNRRGEVQNIEQEEHSSIVTAKLPVAEMFGFEATLKSATGGKGFQSLIDVGFEKLGSGLRDNVAIKIRQRKRMPKDLPVA